MIQKAVIDRFEGEIAVLLIGDENRKLNVPRALLPKDAREGSWLKVDVDGETLLGAEIDEAETNQVKARIEDKLARLRRGEHRKKNKND